MCAINYHLCLLTLSQSQLHTANYTDLVSFTVDCSTQTGVPVVVVRAEPPLREEITMRLSVNPKAAYSVKCTAYNETGYFNYTVGVSKH